MSIIKKVNMIILLQPNLEIAVEFYKSLGLPLKFHLKDKWAEFEVGDIKIGLCPISQRIERRTGVVFEVENVKDTYEKLKDTVTFVDEPYEAIHGVMVSLKDPGGNIVDLYQPTPEKVEELIKKTAEQQGCCGGGSCADDRDRC